jgi:FixJ family two-component response regulator
MSIKPCVFIVDDDDAVRDGLGLVVETAGFAFQSFANAEHFLEAYHPGHPAAWCLTLICRA